MIRKTEWVLRVPVEHLDEKQRLLQKYVVYQKRQGMALTSHEVTVELVAATTTRTALRIIAGYDQRY